MITNPLITSQKTRRLLFITFTALSIHAIAQTNNYPTTGDVTIYNYSPSLILQRNTTVGGFIEGIQTRLQDGTDNWYFGALLTGQWIVSKGNHSNPKMTILDNGNVGIGTTTPQSKLDVNNSIRISPYTVGAVGTGYLNTGVELKLMNGNIYNPGGNSITKISFGGMYNPSGSAPIDCIYNSIAWASGQLKIQNNQQDKIIIGGGDEWGQQNVSINPQGGNVGIGTTTPNAKLDIQGKLHVGGEIYGYNMLTFQDDSRFSVTSATIPSLTYSPFSMPQYGIAAPNTGGSADLWIAGSNAIRMFTAGNPTPGVNILSSGNVGIGTTNPDQKLTVKGKIHAEEVIVDLNVPVADYVFKPNYKLMPLPEVEQFVKINSHLPEIQSANEITKNGLSMGEMQNKLLQKVEELTLYVIQQDKGKKELEAKLVKQENQYNALLEKVEMLTKQIKKK